MSQKHLVFISYSHDNIDLVEIIERDLENHESLSTVVIARDEKPLIQLTEKVKRGIDSSSCVVPLLTKESKNTQWINQEIGYSIAKKKALLPLIQGEIRKELKGFIHENLDLPFSFDSLEEFILAWKKIKSKIISQIEEKTLILNEEEYTSLTQLDKLQLLENILQNPSKRPILIKLSRSIMDEAKSSFDFDIASAESSVVLTKLDELFDTYEFPLKYLAQGVFYSDNSQFKDFFELIKSFQKVSNPKNPYNSFWENFKHFPLVLSIYTTGVAAILKGDLVIIRELFKLKHIKYQNEVGRIEPILNILYFIDLRSQRELFKRTGLPFNRKIFELMQESFSDIVYSEDSFKEAFYYFEFIVSLKYDSMEKNEFLKEYVPPGLYYLDFTPIKDKVNQAFEEKENFELIKAGLFDDFTNLNLSITNVLTHRKKYMGHLIG